MSEQARFDADDLIYNHFDLIYTEGNRRIVLRERGIKYCLDIHTEGVKAQINIWGKPLPQDVFDRAIKEIFADKQICAIELVRCGNPYDDFLEKVNDIRVPLPDSVDELLGRVERRDRATIRRKKKWLDERIGRLELRHFSRKEIPDELVERYFEWKWESHRTDYQLKPQEYLEQYHVTDALLLKAGEISVAVAFYCRINNIVFFENFSYNSELKEYSPGLLMYETLLEKLIQEKCKFLYLGGGDYIYKKRFGAESRAAYSGIIYRPEILNLINMFFQKRNVSTIAIYGMGVCGKTFLNLRKKLTVNILYGIDQKGGKDMEIPIYLPKEDVPMADAAVITMNSRHTVVEKFLAERFPLQFYWNDILTSVQNEYLQRRT